MTPKLWPIALTLAVGAVLATAGVRAQRSLPLRQSLGEAVPRTVVGYGSREIRIPDDQLEVVGVTNYLSRAYERPDTSVAGPSWFLIYVGYYDRQASGKTIHSPQNCLPGGGWEPLSNTVATIATEDGAVQVNRYLIQNDRRQAIVLYWYQGRGRVAHNEYMVKWDLVRDAALRRRSEEALVRIVVPIQGTEAEAFELAASVARRLVPTVGTALPS